MFCHLTQQRQNPAWRPSRKNVRYGVCISDLPWLRLSENRSHDEVDRRSLYRSPLKFGPSSSSSSSRGQTDVQRRATKREKNKRGIGTRGLRRRARGGQIPLYEKQFGGGLRAAASPGRRPPGSPGSCWAPGTNSSFSSGCPANLSASPDRSSKV